MMILEYDKREFRLFDVGGSLVYRCGYQKMSLTNGIYHFTSDNGDRYHIPKDKVVIRELSSNNLLPTFFIKLRIYGRTAEKRKSILCVLEKRFSW